MNPPLPLPVLLPLLAIVAGVALFFSWRTSRDLARGRRILLLALRAAALAVVAVIALNPGRYVSPVSKLVRPWLVLRDVSASMAVKDAGAGASRSDAADVIVKRIRGRGETAGVPVVVRGFDSAVRAEIPAGVPAPAPTGEGTDIAGSLSDALRDADAAGLAPAGVILLGDGRRTSGLSAATTDAAVMRARAREIPVDTVVLGDTATPSDVELDTGNREVLAFPGESVRVPFRVVANGLGRLKVAVTLADAAGKALATTTVALEPGKSASGALAFVAPEKSARLTVSTPVVAGEVRAANNRGTLRLRVVATKTRVLVIEGAPYWDSKFLAQLLRRQKHMAVLSVHRLGEDRYFRTDSEAGEEGEVAKAVFPETVAELARYDLVVFGKNVDGFLTPTRIAALRDYVREEGGAVLFSRGRAFSGETPPAFAALEPVRWGSGTNPEFRFRPTEAGEADGLFGEDLPGVASTVWNALPPLKDARAVAEVKPFARILAEGESGGAKFPALVVRRQGRGVCGLVNGDGLWRWDFFPEARELGNAYEDFWIRLVRRMASYSEFLPGRDWSLRLSAARGAPGESVTLASSYRGREKEPAPRIRITDASGKETFLVPAAVTDEAGRRVWKTAFTPDRPGAWTLAVIDAGTKAAPPEADYIVPPSPSEADDLSPDPAFLAALAERTKGAALTSQTLPAFLEKNIVAEPPDAVAGVAVWKPAWACAPLALLLAALLTAEWWIRRRLGLA